MFDVAIQFMSQLVDIMPWYIGLWVVFDFTGSLLFDKR